MSYSIIRIAKIKASGVTGIQIHDQREKDKVSHTNEDIDWTKTSENVSLLKQQERFRTVVSKRIDELDLKRQPRSDATVMCQCLITSDNAFFDKMSRQEQTEYFKKNLDFIKERYGEKNLVSATIHYDERTPHMHVNFVPVTNDGRLSAKDLFSPKSLRVLQDDYNRFVRENGYDLQRGEIDSKKKHLEVDEYKIETKYKELKAKEQELEKLEKVNKAVDLRAEKGKLTYSTKEVDAIKEQNRALKVANYSKDREIQELKNDLAEVSKRLLKTQNELKGTEHPLNRLKDLENENRALQSLKKSNKDIDKAMEQFDKMKERAYSFGNMLAECKEVYHSALDDREKLITRSSVCEKMVKDCDSKAADLKNLDRDISSSLAREITIKAELESLNGIFKKKAREDCQNRLEKQKSTTKGLIDRLQKDHCIKPEHISNKLTEYAEQKQNFIKEKIETMEKTDKVEQLVKQAVYSYKFHKPLSYCQQADLRDISDRIDARVKLRPDEERTFRLSQEDRKQLLKDYEGKVEPRIIEKCKGNFECQDEKERQARIKPIEHTQTESREWSMER